LPQALRSQDIPDTSVASLEKFYPRVAQDLKLPSEQARFDMKTRDRHLLGLIEQQLTERHSVLVVFGGSHWATLSAALIKQAGFDNVAQRR
jgi:hypothetical protein